MQYYVYQDIVAEYNTCLHAMLPDRLQTGVQQ